MRKYSSCGRFVLLFAVVAVLISCTRWASENPSATINSEIIQNQSGFSGSAGTKLIAAVDLTGKHPLRGLDGFLGDPIPGTSTRLIVGLRVKRLDADDVLIGRTTDHMDSLTIPDKSYVLDVQIKSDGVSLVDQIISIYVHWVLYESGATGTEHLGNLTNGPFEYNYVPFPTQGKNSCYEIIGFEGYVDKNSTLKSLGVVRTFLQPVTPLSRSGITDGPCGPAIGSNGSTDTTPSDKLLRIKLWADVDGLYGIKISHGNPNGGEVQEGKLFGNDQKGKVIPLDFGPTEYMSRVGGRIDSTGVRLLVIEVYDYKTGKVRRISTSNEPDPWKEANLFDFNLPKLPTSSGPVPNARIYGFHGWVHDGRITSIGPQYATPLIK